MVLISPSTTAPPVKAGAAWLRLRGGVTRDQRTERCGINWSSDVYAERSKCNIDQRLIDLPGAPIVATIMLDVLWDWDCKVLFMFVLRQKVVMVCQCGCLKVFNGHHFPMASGDLSWWWTVERWGEREGCLREMTLTWCNLNQEWPYQKVLHFISELAVATFPSDNWMEIGNLYMVKLNMEQPTS